MTYQECAMKLAEIKADIAAIDREAEQKKQPLKDRAMEITSKFLALAPFQPGDKVRITSHKKGQDAFISEVKIGYKTNPYDYNFLKAKNDGSPSKTKFHIWVWDYEQPDFKIELIQKANT